MATLLTKLIVRNDTLENWNTADSSSTLILSKGELGIAWCTVSGSTFPRFKIGDGVTHWTALPYFNESDVTISGSGNTVVDASYDSSTGKLTLTKGNRLTGSGLTADTILLGNGGVDVKTSSKKITTTAPVTSSGSTASYSTDDTVLPTSKAVADAIKTFAGTIITGVSSVSADSPLQMKNSGSTGAVTVQHKTVGPSSTYASGNTTTSIGAGESKTIKIPQLTVDTYGHTTAAADEDVTITIPSIPSLSKSGSKGTDDKFITDISVSGHTITATYGGLSTLGLASALVYKGSVATYSALPTSGQKTGDVWNVEATDETHKVNAGDNVCWNGSTWDNLGNYVDLSNVAYLDANNHFTGNNTIDSATIGNLVVSGGATGNFTGSLTGNATSADKVNHSISLKNSSNTTVSFNGSADVDLTGGIYYAVTANTATKANRANITTTTNAIAKYSDTTGTFANTGVTIDSNNKLTTPSLTVTNTTGFNYSGIETGSDSVYRDIWFANSGSKGIPVVNDSFQYNPGTNTLKVGGITLTSGSLSLSTLSADTANIGNLSVTGTASFTNIINGSISGNSATTTTADKTKAAVTFNNGGSGSASGTTFNGSSAVTVSYNTIGAVKAITSTDNDLVRFDGTAGQLQGSKWSVSDSGELQFKGTKATYTVISPIDNTSDANGNGVMIGCGGVTVIGSGEAAGILKNGKGWSAGSESLGLGSDEDVCLMTNLQSGYNYGKEFSFKTTGQLSIPAATGTAPLAIASTTMVSNLNADMVDGKHASDFASATAHIFNSLSALSSGSSGWYTLATISDGNTSPALFTVGTYAHNGMIFTVSKGYATSGVVNILNYNNSCNGSYCTISAVRLLSNGTVQILLNKPAANNSTYVNIRANAICANGTDCIASSLVLDETSYPTSSVSIIVTRTGAANKITSDLDGSADTVDGFHASQLVQIANDQTITGKKTFNDITSATIGNLTVNGSAVFNAGLTGNLTGNASTATKVNNSVTFNNSGSGAASGSSFDGSTARTISYNTVGAAPTSHASSATTYGAGTTANYGHVKTQSGDMNGTTSTDGIAAGLGHTHSQYSTTDEKVKQSLSDTSNWRRILQSSNYVSSYTTAITNNTTSTIAYSDNVSIQPSTGSLAATRVITTAVDLATTIPTKKATMQYNSTDDCIEFVFA